MKHSFLTAQSKHASPFIPGLQRACNVSCRWGVRALILGLAGNNISCSRVCHGSEAWKLSSWHGYLAVKYSVSKGPPPPRYTCCHHISMARRHSLSQQMRGLSERAPQFLRDCGEAGGSRRARLWFLPTVSLLVKAGPDHAALTGTPSATWTWEAEWPVLCGGASFPCCELNRVASLSLILFHLDRRMVLWFSDTIECPCWVKLIITISPVKPIFHQVFAKHIPS